MIRDDYAQERRAALAAARSFSSACEVGDAKGMLVAARQLNVVGGWRFAMLRVSRLNPVKSEVRSAFLQIWIESKMLPLRIGNRRTLSNALRILMSCEYSGPPLRLYRGTMSGERRRRIYGFSWTTSFDVARDKFAAERRAFHGGAVVLETVAPPDAILLVRKKEDYYDEDEVVIDPFKLFRVNVAIRLPPLAKAQLT